MRYMGLEYESLQENSVKIVGYSGKEKFIIVPQEIGGKPVRATAKISRASAYPRV